MFPFDFGEKDFEQKKQLNIFGISLSDSNTSGSSGTLTNSYTGTQSVSGTDTASNTDTTTSANSESNTNTSSTQNEINSTDTQTQSNLNTAVSNTSSTSLINSSNPAVVAALEALTSSATNYAAQDQSLAANATQETAGVVSGLLQSAQDSFASVFGQQGAAGLYNASSTQVQENNTIARTAADAASTVLGYQAQEQNLAQQQEAIASGGLSNLLTALGTQTNLGSQTTLSSTSSGTNTLVNQVLENVMNSSSGTTSSALSNTDVSSLISALTVANQKTQGNSSTDTNSQSNTAKAGTIVCTEMLSHGLMELREYATVHSHYKKHYSESGKSAYHFWGRRIVSKLRRDRTSKLSRFYLSLFTSRTNFVCWRLTGVPPLTWARIVLGFISYWFIHICCIPPGIFFFFHSLVKKQLAKRELGSQKKHG